MKYLSAAEMRALERRAIEELGIPALRLMERAGQALAGEAFRLAGVGNYLVICGYGNNGGDGLAAGRLLAERGGRVRLFLVGPPRPFTAETAANFEALRKTGLAAGRLENTADLEVLEPPEPPAAVIDAIFGIGLRGPLEGFYADLVERINSLGVPVAAADLPSGLDADRGEPLGCAVRASVTVTFGHPKLGFRNPAAAAYLGRVVVADIGLPPDNL